MVCRLQVSYLIQWCECECWQILVNNFVSDYINFVHAPFLLMIIHITFSSRKLSNEEGLLFDTKEQP